MDSLLTLEIIVIINAILSYLIYMDSRRRHIGEPKWWAVATFLFAIVTIPIYLILGKKEADHQN